MNGGTAATIDDSLYSNWLPSGVWQGLFSGFYVGGLNLQGSDGNYWSSTAGDTGNAFSLGFNDENVFPDNSDYKAVGYAVRCTI